MAMIPFGQYRPDVSDLNANYSSRMQNAVPRADGFGPFRALATFTQSLGAACRGFFFAGNTDGSITIFAGTETELYKLDNTTLAWTKVSKDGGPYAALPSDANWQFRQFNNIVLATQKNVALQSFDLASDVAFDDLDGDPPQAGSIAIVGRFVVLCDLLDSPFRVQWSGLNDIEEWTAGTNNSDYQDLPDGARPRAIAEMSGDVGLILQEGAVRRMVFAPGSEVVFQIDRVASDIGLLAPYSVTTAAGMAFFVSTKGFVQMDASGNVSFIGEERNDRTFLADYDTDASRLVQAQADPTRNIVAFAYKSLAGAAGLFDKLLLYHWTLKQWAPVSISGEYLSRVARPGLTLEGLDAIAPGAQDVAGAADNGSGLIRIEVASTAGWTTGQYKTITGVTGTTEANGTWQITVINSTHIDLVGSTFANNYVSGGLVAGSIDSLPFSLDDVSTATLPSVAAFGTQHRLGFFTGATLETVLDTPEQSVSGYRININGFRPITDAPTLYGFSRMRDNLNTSPADGDESLMDEDGYCPLLDEARFARGAVRIPAGTEWTFAQGIEPDILKAGLL